MSHALSISSKDNHVDCLKSFDWKLLKSAGSPILYLEHLFDGLESFNSILTLETDAVIN